MNSVCGWAGVPVWEILHYTCHYAFERCVFMPIFLSGENPTDLTHMNGSVADTFGAVYWCMVERTVSNSISDMKRKGKPVLLLESRQGCSNLCFNFIFLSVLSY